MAKIDSAALEALITKGSFTALEGAEIVRGISGQYVYGPDLMTQLKSRKGYVLTREVRGYRDRIYHFQKVSKVDAA